MSATGVCEAAKMVASLHLGINHLPLWIDVYLDLMVRSTIRERVVSGVGGGARRLWLVAVVIHVRRLWLALVACVIHGRLLWLALVGRMRRLCRARLPVRIRWMPHRLPPLVPSTRRPVRIVWMGPFAL